MLSDNNFILFCSNLDETTRSVYKENVRLNEALAYHLEENELLKKTVKSLQEENDLLNSEKEMSTMAVQEKIISNKQLKQQVKEVHLKILILMYYRIIATLISIPNYLTIGIIFNTDLINFIKYT